MPIRISDATVTDVVEISTVSGAKALKVDVIQAVQNKAEDSGHVSGDIGTFILAVRNDAGATTFTSADLDYSPVSCDDKGRIGITTLGGSLSVTVTGSVTISSNYAEDSGHVSGNVGDFVLGVRNDTQATLTSTDLDYSPISVDKSGNVLTVEAGRADGVITNYGTVSSVAHNATGTVTYVVPVGKTFYLKQILASSSGAPCKVVVDYGVGPTTIFTGFYSSANPLIDVTFAQPIPIAASTSVNTKITNMGGMAQDIYSTIIGFTV